MSVYDDLELRQIESLPFPHTFRDPEIKTYMRENFLPDEPGSYSYSHAHREAFTRRDPGYLAFMRGHFSRWQGVTSTNDIVVRSYREQPSEGLLKEQLQRVDPHAWSWLVSPIEIIDRPDDCSLGNGQHRVMALRLFGSPGVHVVCRVFR